MESTTAKVALGAMWSWLEAVYPYAGSTDVTPIAAFFDAAERIHVGDDRRSPPPAVASTVHMLVRKDLAKVSGNPIHAAAYDGRASWVLPFLQAPPPPSNLVDLDLANEESSSEPNVASRPSWRLTSERCVHPIHAAALGGQSALLTALMQAYGSELDDVGRGVAHYIAMCPSPRAAKWVADSSSDPELSLTLNWATPDAMRFTPMHYAALTGSAALIEALACLAAETLDAKSSFNELPIHMAARSGDIAKLKVLVALQEPSVTPANVRDLLTYHGATVVHYALRGPNVAMVEHCVEAYFDKDWGAVPETRMHSGGLLKSAGRSPNPALFALARKHFGRRPPLADDDGWTPVHSACAAGNLAMLRYLVDVEKYSPYAVDEDGYTVLHAAISSDSTFFFDQVASMVNDDIRSKHYTEHESLASLAVGKSNLEMLQHLVAQGYYKFGEPVSLRRPKYTLLHEVIKSGAGIALVEWVLQQGIRCWNAKDEFGGTPWYYVFAKRAPGLWDIFNRLKERYPDPETTLVAATPAGGSAAEAATAEVPAGVDASGGYIDEAFFSSAPDADSSM